MTAGEAVKRRDLGRSSLRNVRGDQARRGDHGIDRR
jgi:hypothetical protein